MDESMAEEEREDCVICLGPIKEVAIADPCGHAYFDFHCLMQWLNERSICPLCNAVVRHVKDHQGVSTVISEPSSAASPLHLLSSAGEGAPPQDVALSQGRSRRDERAAQVPQRAGRQSRRGVSEAEIIRRRRQVYRYQLYSMHIGSNRYSGYRDFTPAEFAASGSLQARARLWIERELLVFTHLHNRHPPGRRSTVQYLRELLVAALTQHEIKAADGRLEDIMAAYLGRKHARLFLHELQGFLRSPCFMAEQYDDIAIYSPGPSPRR